MQLQNCEILKKVASKTTFLNACPGFLAGMKAQWDKCSDKDRRRGTHAAADHITVCWIRISVELPCIYKHSWPMYTRQICAKFHVQWTLTNVTTA